MRLISSLPPHSFLFLLSMASAQTSVCSCCLVPIADLVTDPQSSFVCRYSKDYKFRPAASPVVTERLKDGRIRLRGAHVGHDL